MSQSIVEKLKLNKYDQLVVLNMPQGDQLLPGLKPFDTSWLKESYDLIFAFVLDCLRFN